MAAKQEKRLPQSDDGQIEKFEKLARELECDEDEARWDERLKKVAKGGIKNES